MTPIPFQKIPGPFKFPLIGNLHLFKLGVYKVSDYHKVLKKLYDRYGSVVRVQLGPPSATIVHLFDPDHAEAVHTREGKMPYVKPLQATVQQYRKVKEKSLGLGNTNGEDWYRLRSAVRQIMLRPQEVQSYLPAINMISDEMTRRLVQKRNCKEEIVNLRSELSKWSREVAGWICFGRRLGSMDDGIGEATAQQIIDANRIVFRISAQLKFSLPFYHYMPTPLWNQLVAAEDLITEHGFALVEEAVQSIRNGTLDCHFLKYLLSRSELSDRDISTITLSVFTDGLSTMVPTLLCCLHCLAANPKIQEEAFEEIRSVVKNGEVTSAALNQMPFLKAFVKEVFRLYPNGVETDRILHTDHEIGGYHLPAGTNVTLNQIVNFRSEKYFDHPDEFLPHRWLRDQGASSIHNFLLLPFGYGSRSCIGRRFAEQDLYVSLSKILLKFSLKKETGPPLELVYETLLFPQEPLLIQFKLRQPK